MAETLTKTALIILALSVNVVWMNILQNSFVCMVCISLETILRSHWEDGSVNKVLAKDLSWVPRINIKIYVITIPEQGKWRPDALDGLLAGQPRPADEL